MESKKKVMSALEPAAAAIKDQTAKFQATVDQWVQSQQQQVDEVHKGHRDTMMLAEGTWAFRLNFYPFSLLPCVCVCVCVCGSVCGPSVCHSEW
jgi:hypothetical protein